jgi:hypothetical protein
MEGSRLTITANIEQLPKDDIFYRELEITMQRMGHLTPFREELNWDEKIETLELGSGDQLHRLKKAAAKNDGTLLFFAKWMKSTVYRHLILHPNNNGFYLPFRFDEPFTLDIQNQKIWVGSSVRLLEELNWLQITMERDQDQDSELIDFWKTLRELCRKSTKHTSAFQLNTASGDE